MTPARALFEAQRTAGKSLQQIATDCGLSKGAIVGYHNGNYAADVKGIEKKIVAAYGSGVRCPHLAKQLTHDQCVAYHSKAMPTSSPLALAHWTACQRCANNPKAPKQPTQKEPQ